MIKRSYGLPRVLNIICFNIMMEAAEREFTEIGTEELSICWNACNEQLRRRVLPDFRDTLELMTQRGEPLNVEAVPDGWFERLRIDRHEEMVQQLNYALKSELLVTRNGREVVLNAILWPFDHLPDVEPPI